MGWIQAQPGVLHGVGGSAGGAEGEFHEPHNAGSCRDAAASAGALRPLPSSELGRRCEQRLYELMQGKLRDIRDYCADEIALHAPIAREHFIGITRANWEPLVSADDRQIARTLPHRAWPAFAELDGDAGSRKAKSGVQRFKNALFYAPEQGEQQRAIHNRGARDERSFFGCEVVGDEGIVARLDFLQIAAEVFS